MWFLQLDVLRTLFRNRYWECNDHWSIVVTKYEFSTRHPKRAPQHRLITGHSKAPERLRKTAVMSAFDHQNQRGPEPTFHLPRGELLPFLGALVVRKLILRGVVYGMDATNRGADRRRL